jgi:SAM-dependent methyltransferase
MTASTATAPTADGELRRLITGALNRSYTSASSKDGILTGNHYQSVTLGSETSSGFRSFRADILDRVQFTGQKVLDLGCNLGELSRMARARGAAVVDGFEYDRYFLEIARLVNVYNAVTRVSFFQRDITDPAIYGEHYDIVLAFSVYEYLQGVLGPLRDITDGVLILETHRLEGNLESAYLAPIGRFFPHHAILGNSDWGSGPDKVGERAVIAFAKTDDALRSYLTGLGQPGQHFRAGRRRQTEPDIRTIDVRKTPWYDRFFDAFAFNSAQDLLTAVEKMEFDVDSLARNRDLRKDLGGWTYWLAYLKGALQWERDGDVTEGNAYYDLLARHWKNDPARATDLGDSDRLRALIRRRFEDFKVFRTDREAPLKTAPLRLVVANGPPTPSVTRDVKRIYVVGSEVPVETSTFDGYHRLFLARLFGHTQVRCDFVAERDALTDPKP